MAVKRVTMQDIADKCGLSRNTVSKIFNGRGNVPEATRNIVIEAAKELGYFQGFQPEPNAAGSPSEADNNLSIAVLSHSNPTNHSFGSFFIKSFTDQVCRVGFTVRMYEVSDAETEKLILPPNISTDNTAGILCIELFDKEYIKKVCSLGLPTIVVDGYQNITRSFIPCDVISMENIVSSARLTNKLIHRGAKTIGFVGDIEHCNSFYERWQGFVSELANAAIPLDKNICILDSDDNPYGDLEWLNKRIDRMPYIPDAFVCANDFHAIHIMSVLKRRGLSIPKDVMVTGFDDSPESAIVEPPLTTAKIPASDMGLQAAELLLARIANPGRSYSITHIKTVPIYRESIK